MTPPHPDTERLHRFPPDQPDRLEVEPLYARLRPTTPVVRVRLPVGGAGWLLTRYDDIRTALSSPQCLRGPRSDPDTPRILPVPASEGILMRLDGDEHAALRAVLVPWFTARRAQSYRESTRAAARDLIADMRATAELDLFENFAQPLSAIVIGDLLGVPRTDRDQFHRWSVALLSSEYRPEHMRATVDSLEDYFTALVAERRRRPRNDVLSALVEHADAGHLTSDQVVELARDILVAGFETTARQLVNSIYVLSMTPGAWHWLQQDRTRVPTAVEELLRFIPLGAGGFRLRVTDAPLPLGQDTPTPITIGPNEVIVAPTSAANTDPGRFDDPFDLRLDRQANQHLTFGHGAHRCLGAQFARMELDSGLHQLLEDVPTVALAIPEQDLQWSHGLQVRGPRALPIRSLEHDT
ncbi:MAG: cytochrome P450 [Rhodococcus sp. (in: high G+C Gram-positive bacteria)]